MARITAPLTSRCGSLARRVVVVVFVVVTRGGITATDFREEKNPPQTGQKQREIRIVTV
jgi:hypothetical protein